MAENISKGFTEEKFIARLGKNGLKATPQRLVIHRAMMELIHASADMVDGWIKDNSSIHITVASIYNNLSQMVLKGIYGSRMSASGKMFFDLFSEPHIHMYDCERDVYRDIFDSKLYNDILERVGSRRFRGYSIEKLDVQFVVRPTSKSRRNK